MKHAMGFLKVARTLLGLFNLYVVIELGYKIAKQSCTYTKKAQKRSQRFAWDIK